MSRDCDRAYGDPAVLVIIATRKVARPETRACEVIGACGIVVDGYHWENAMDDLSTEPRPAELDAWLRAHLERPIRAVGLSLAPNQAPGGDIPTIAPPAAWLAEVAAYSEWHLRWTPVGVGLEEALRRAAEQVADVLFCWLAGTAQPDAATADDQAQGILARLVARADRLGLRDRCVIALIGPAATQQRARHAGCDSGFALHTPPARVLAELAREVAGRDAFCRGGSSPPCYL